jgi:hypothetical protein
MKVRLPNGVVISGVPEDVSKSELRDKAISAGFASEEDFPEIQEEKKSQEILGFLAENGWNLQDIE